MRNTQEYFMEGKCSDSSALNRLVFMTVKSVFSVRQELEFYAVGLERV